MIAAKEKARDLVNTFYCALPNNGSQEGLNSTTSRYKEGIRCALIAVDEMIEEISKWAGGEFQEWEKERWKYLQEVKQEIELL
jgi:hypothetical protein